MNIRKRNSYLYVPTRLRLSLICVGGYRGGRVPFIFLEILRFFNENSDQVNKDFV